MKTKASELRFCTQQAIILLNISTALQSRYRSQLIGYNLIWGLNMPDSFLRKGNDINLTVDADTCAAAYDVLSGYGNGACVVYVHC